MKFKQQKHLHKREWQIINCEHDVNCGIISFWYKISFLTCNVSLLQRGIGKELQDVKKIMKENLEIIRKENREDLLMMKVSSPTRSSNLHHFTVIHHGVDIMSSDLAFLYQYFEADLHLNYKKLCHAAA
jgi:hypothetical protein